MITISEYLKVLELDDVGVTAAIQPDGTLSPVGGLWEKLGEQTIDLAKRGLLHTVIVSDRQDDVPPEYLGEDAEPLRVIKAKSVADAVRQLHEASLPRRAFLQKVREECSKLDILGVKQVPMETYYQVLPLLREVKREKLPRFERGREASVEQDDSEGRGGRVELLRWEEEMLNERVTYKLHEVRELFADFQQVVKGAKSNVPRFVVLGLPGSGKTTLEQYLAWQAAIGKLRLEGSKLIPVRVRLRDWERWAVKKIHPEHSLPEYLAERYKDIKHAPTVEQWRRWLQQGDTLMLLDGLDEIATSEPSFDTALKNALGFSNCPTVLSCRTVSFKRLQELCPELPVFTLAGLEDSQRDAYIRAFPANYPDHFDPSALIAQLHRTPQMRPLASNPLLLSIICYVVDDPGGVRLPAARTQLYDKAVDKLLTRARRVEVSYPGNKPDLPLIRKRRILERAAFTLFAGMEQQRQLTFDEGSLVDALTQGAKAEELDKPADVADSLLCDLIQNSGILRGDADRGYFFLHLTIHEFLTACALARSSPSPLPVSPVQAKLRKFRELIGRPYFWDVVRQAILMDDSRIDIIKLLAKESDDIVKNMAIACLTSLAKDEGKVSIASSIVSDLINLKGKGDGIQNAKTVAIQVASELCRIKNLVEPSSNEEKLLLGVLEKGIYDKSEMIRNAAYEYIYYLSADNPSAALKILDSVSQRAKFTWRIPLLVKSLQACGAISLLMYCDTFEASVQGQTATQETVQHLHEMWRGIIKRCKPLLLLWGIKRKAKSIVQDEVGVSDPFNFEELKHFFEVLSEEQKNVLIELTPYFKLERQDLLSVADTIVEVSKWSDMLSFYQVIQIFAAQASIGNIDQIYQIADGIYQEGCAFSRGVLLPWALGVVDDLDNSRFDKYQALLERLLDDTESWWIRSKIGKKEYCPESLAMLLHHQFKAFGNIDLAILDKYLKKGKGQPKLLWFIIQNMRALAIYCNHPSTALVGLKRIIDDGVSDSDVRDRLVEALTYIKIFYPEAIEDLLQSSGDKLLAKEKETIRTAKSSEPLGHLFGLKLGPLTNHMCKHPHLRNAFADCLAAAPKCKNLGVWIDQAFRRLGNYIMGEEILKVIPVDEEE